MENMKNSELSAPRSIRLSVYFGINADFAPYFMKRAVTAVLLLATRGTVTVPEGGGWTIATDICSIFMITQYTAANVSTCLSSYWLLLGGKEGRSFRRGPQEVGNIKHV